jgi:bifunctional non-homologous end joining protein LigD
MPARPSRSTAHAKLATYRRKRDFASTAEPSGAKAAPSPGGDSFVVQKHAARRLHYDFRLELGGVLLSWAVPRGPSLDPKERRLAVRTEDHPMDYADFEGVIPEGEYGGGTVIVWDRGRWTPEGDAAKDLARGRLTFDLHGEKLSGRFHLVRTGRDKATGEKSQWLLFKSKDEAARPGSSITDERPESVLSRRTLEAVGEAPSRTWHSNRADKKGKPPATGETSEIVQLVKQLPTKVVFSNLDKILYPEDGLTKATLVAYHATMAERLLTYAGGRPLTLVRCPDGHGKQCFYQKHAGKGTPRQLGHVAIPEDDGETATYMRVDDRDGVLALAQFGVLEIHVWGARADQVERPDTLIFDLDPDPSVGWKEVVQAAHDVRGVLDALGLASFVKTTGGKGLHVVAPVERRIAWDPFKAFARAVAERLAEAQPHRFVTNLLKKERKGKIFLDYLRNGRGATAIAPYSPRARPHAPVATPVGWDELDGLRPGAFTVLTLPAILDARKHDPWADYAAVKQTISKAMMKEIGART